MPFLSEFARMASAVFLSGSSARVLREARAAFVAGVRAAVPHASTDANRFFEALVALPALHSTLDLAERLAVHPVTLTSRFLRADLPSPKTYLSWARALEAVALLEQGATSAQCATLVGYSSREHFQRHCVLLLGHPTSHYRHRGAADALRASFLQTLVQPCAVSLADLRLAGEPGRPVLR
ncbi:MAG: helix-turn-helix transcriptional regulator [Gemmatimonadaceae bacterium]|nr:helix-turn-helix transcriptional regulator [Gemmatimonadaceae bacterium]